MTENGTQPSDAPAPMPQSAGEEDEFAQCEKLRNEYLAGWQRAKADYLNLQKELGELIGEEFEAGKLVILREVLPILDSHAMAIKNAPQELKENNWARGIVEIGESMTKVLMNLGVTPMETSGKPFDPAYHESLESVASDQPEGAIIEELQKGYMYKGRVLRPARVKIAKASSSG